MKHKLYTVLAALLLLFNAVPVYASNTLPIFHANNYDYSMGGGVSHIPYLSLEIMK